MENPQEGGLLQRSSPGIRSWVHAETFGCAKDTDHRKPHHLVIDNIQTELTYNLKALKSWVKYDIHNLEPIHLVTADQLDKIDPGTGAESIASIRQAFILLKDLSNRIEKAMDGGETMTGTPEELIAIQDLSQKCQRAVSAALDLIPK